MEIKLNQIKEEDYTRRKYCIEDYSYDGLIRVRNVENSKYGYIDNAGNLVIPCLYEYATNFSEGYAVVMDDNNTLIYNSEGKIVTSLKEKYHHISSFHNGLALVKIDVPYNYSIHNFINTKGEKLLSNGVNNASEFSDGFALIYNYDTSSEPVIIDTKGKPHPEFLERYLQMKKIYIFDLKIDSSGFKNGLLKINAYNRANEILSSNGFYIYKNGRFFNQNEDLDALYDFRMPKYLEEKPLDFNNELLNEYCSGISYFDEKITLCADTKEELQEKKKEFYESLKISLANYNNEINSKINGLSLTK